MSFEGPFINRSKGRRFIVLYKNGKRTTKFYAKHILEQKLGRELLPHETADHIDGNKLNDDPDNIQLLSRIENTQKHIVEKHGGLNLTIEVTCAACGVSFTKLKRVESERIKLKRGGPYCSRSCASSINGTSNALGYRRKQIEKQNKQGMLKLEDE